jgi:dihydroxy-acid dehydratase
LSKRRSEQNTAGWKPVAERPRKISAALKVYAKMVTSADTGAVRDLSLLD